MRRRERRSGLNSLLALVASCVLFFAIFAYQIRTRHLFSPGPASYGESHPHLRWLETGAGSPLAVYWAPVEEASWTVFYFHGGAEDFGQVEDALATYRLQGMNVISFDYRGFGLSEGRPSEGAVYDDSDRVYRLAVEELGLAPHRVILHGRALGAAVAMRLAIREQPAGLILEAPFRSALRLHLPMLWLPGDVFDSQSMASRVVCPTLVIHGEADEVVPLSHGRDLAERLGGGAVKRLWLPEAGHHDLRQVSGERYWAAIRAFVAGL